ncbi:MAG TPA: hypothetical protein VII62_18930 [Vicinamibacteria bacterium]
MKGRSARVLALLLLPAALACSKKFEGGGDLRAQKVVLEREVEGYREAAARLERGEPVLPKEDVAIAIADSLVRDLIAAQLPFEADVDKFHIALRTAEVKFRGSPVVELTGALNLKNRPNLQAAARVIGALEGIAVDPATATLKARISVDHLAIEQVAGFEQLLSGSTLDEVGRMIRLQIKEKLPEIQIPVKVQQSIELPAVTRGPVRLDGARMPLQVAVSQVLAGQGILWIAVHFQPGDLVKTADAPEVADTNASDVDAVGLDDADAAKGGKPDAKPDAKKKEKGQ